MRAPRWLQGPSPARWEAYKNAPFRRRLVRWLLLGGIPYYVLSVVFGEPHSHRYLRRVFPTVLWAVTAACLEHVVMRL